MVVVSMGTGGGDCSRGSGCGDNGDDSNGAVWCADGGDGLLSCDVDDEYITVY